MRLVPAQEFCAAAKEYYLKTLPREKPAGTPVAASVESAKASPTAAVGTTTEPTQPAERAQIAVRATAADVPPQDNGNSSPSLAANSPIASSPKPAVAAKSGPDPERIKSLRERLMMAKKTARNAAGETPPPQTNAEGLGDSAIPVPDSRDQSPATPLEDASRPKSVAPDTPSGPRTFRSDVTRKPGAVVDSRSRNDDLSSHSRTMPPPAAPRDNREGHGDRTPRRGDSPRRVGGSRSGSVDSKVSRSSRTSRRDHDRRDGDLRSHHSHEDSRTKDSEARRSERRHDKDRDSTRHRSDRDRDRDRERDRDGHRERERDRDRSDRDRRDRRDRDDKDRTRDKERDRERRRDRDSRHDSKRESERESRSRRHERDSRDKDPKDARPSERDRSRDANHKDRERQRDRTPEARRDSSINEKLPLSESKTTEDNRPDGPADNRVSEKVLEQGRTETRASETPAEPPRSTRRLVQRLGIANQSDQTPPVAAAPPPDRQMTIRRDTASRQDIPREETARPKDGPNGGDRVSQVCALIMSGLLH